MGAAAGVPGVLLSGGLGAELAESLTVTGPQGGSFHFRRDKGFLVCLQDQIASPVVAGGLIPAIPDGGCFGFSSMGRGRSACAGGLGLANHPEWHGHRGCRISWGPGWTGLEWGCGLALGWAGAFWPDFLVGLWGLAGWTTTLTLGLAFGLPASW